MTDLLDANVLIALAVADHVHHEPVESWLAQDQAPFATWAVTQGALVRHLLRGGAEPVEVLGLVRRLGTDERHEFWPDDLSYRDVDLRGVVGHRQVTDAYLAALARNRDGRLATLDRGLALLHADVALLIEP